jgi:hypothetical protein
MIDAFAMLAYRPFVSPVPIWNVWPVLLVPLCVAVAVVYKSIKCNTMREVPRQALSITLWIIGGMIAAGAVLAGLVRLVEIAGN